MFSHFFKSCLFIPLIWYLGQFLSSQVFGKNSHFFLTHFNPVLIKEKCIHMLLSFPVDLLLACTAEFQRQYEYSSLYVICKWTLFKFESTSLDTLLTLITMFSIYTGVGFYFNHLQLYTIQVPYIKLKYPSIKSVV